MLPPVYVDSSTSARTRTPDGCARKSYHSSVRVHVSGRRDVAGWTRSMTWTVAVCTAGCRKPCAQQFAVERPFVLGVGGSVNAEEAAARAYPALERRALVVVQHRARGVEKD